MSYVSCLCPNPQEDFYCAVFEAAPSGVFALDPEGTILALNAKAAQIFGYSQQELTGRSVAALLPPRYQSKYLKARSLPLSTGKHR